MARVAGVVKISERELDRVKQSRNGVVDGLVDLAAIDAFLAYHHNKESPVVAVLVDMYDAFDLRWYPMRGAPLEETIMPFIARGFSEANTEILQKICKAWNKVEREDKELRGRSNSVIGGYHKWLKSRVQGIVWLKKIEGWNGEETEESEESEEVRVLKAELEKTKVAKEKLKVVITRVRKFVLTNIFGFFQRFP
ncbi:hypothetical protein HKD37_19G053581 [Glycine soja]